MSCCTVFFDLGVTGPTSGASVVEHAQHLDSFTTPSNHVAGCIGSLWAHLGTMAHQQGSIQEQDWQLQSECRQKLRH